MGGKPVNVRLTTSGAAMIREWKVREGMLVSARQVIFIYDSVGPDPAGKQLKFKCTQVGTVRKLVAKEGVIVHPGEVLLELEECTHPTVMRDMCAKCGEDLRKDDQLSNSAPVAMVQNIPGLKVSEEQAKIIGSACENRLLSDRKLVLLVDLDQTLIHTTNEDIPANLKDVHHFQLHGPVSHWYHTRIRPRTHAFLQQMAKYYELHICTFGTRRYADAIAMFLDPDGKFFSQRILSRDECSNTKSKRANLKAFFPFGDKMICMIDDRADVWEYADNLIPVRAYRFFGDTGDINAPPGLCKKQDDEMEGFHFSNMDNIGKAKKPEEDKQHKETHAVKDKVDILGESTTDKNTEDEAEAESPKEIQDVFDQIVGDLQSEEKPEAKPEAQTEATEGTSKEPKEEESTSTAEEKKPAKNTEDLIEVEDPDDYLTYLEDILKCIHKAYYEEYDAIKDIVDDCGIPDLKVIIPKVKKTVLKGCNLVFSGMIPSQKPLQQSRAYMVAISLGATVAQDVSSTCTHLVAVKRRTAKVFSSRRYKGIHVVNPSWLWHCAERWKRVDEKLYPLGRGVAMCRSPPAHCAIPEESDQYAPTLRGRAPSGSFTDMINPLLTFSSEEGKMTDQEVEDLCTDDDDDDDDDDKDDDDDDDDDETESESEKNIFQEEMSQLFAEGTTPSTSAESLSGPSHPKGWGVEKQSRKRKADTTTCTDSECDEDTPGVKFRRGEPLPSDLDLGEDSQDSPASDDPMDDVDVR